MALACSRVKTRRKDWCPGKNRAKAAQLDVGRTHASCHWQQLGAHSRRDWLQHRENGGRGRGCQVFKMRLLQQLPPGKSLLDWSASLRQENCNRSRTFCSTSSAELRDWFGHRR
eukprot:UN2353